MQLCITVIKKTAAKQPSSNLLNGFYLIALFFSQNKTLINCLFSGLKLCGKPFSSYGHHFSKAWSKMVRKQTFIFVMGGVVHIGRLNFLDTSSNEVTCWSLRQQANQHKCISLQRASTFKDSGLGKSLIRGLIRDM